MGWQAWVLGLGKGEHGQRNMAWLSAQPGNTESHTTSSAAPGSHGKGDRGRQGWLGKSGFLVWREGPSGKGVGPDCLLSLGTQNHTPPALLRLAPTARGTGAGRDGGGQRQAEMRWQG